MKRHLGRIAGTLTMLLAAGCGKNPEQREPPPKPIPLVQAAKAELRNLVKTLTLTGSVEPFRVAQMASAAEGPIIECSAREGDAVKQGQLLVRVGRNHSSATALDAARAELRRQKAEFKRVEQLVKSDVLPGRQLDVARADLSQAEAQVVAMEMEIDDYEIAAPWDGVVSRLWIAEGNYVSPRTPLIEVYDPSSMVVRLSVPEQQALAIQVGQTVQISLDAYPGRRFTGTISRVYAELERNTRTLTAEAVLQDQIRLLSGMFARVEVVFETRPNAIVVPDSALVTLPNGETVAFVLDGEKAVRRKVKVALEAGGAVAIAEGIQPGEMVIIRGNEQLKDGATVKVMGGKKKDGAPPGPGNPDSGEQGKGKGKGQPTS